MKKDNLFLFSASLLAIFLIVSVAHAADELSSEKILTRGAVAQCLVDGYDGGYVGVCMQRHSSESISSSKNQSFCCYNNEEEIRELEESSSLTVMKRDEYANLYYDGDSGEYISEMASEPINYDSGYGVFPIDTTISNKESCELDYCANKGIYTAEFSSNSGSDYPILFKYKSDKIRYTLEDLKYVSEDEDQLIAANQDVEGYANGSVFTYSNVYGEGLHLQYEYTNRILKEELVIADFSSLPTLSLNEENSYLQLQFSMEATTKEGDLEESSEEDLKIFDNKRNVRWWKLFKFDVEGAIAFEGSAERKGFVIPPAYAFDANGDQIPLSYRLEKEQGTIFISVLVPYSWLKAAEYPVRIDPGVEIIAEGFGQVERYDFDLPDGGRYDWESFLTEIDSVDFGGNDGKVARGWAYFNVSFIPDDATITDVNLETYISEVVLDDCWFTSPPTETLYVYSVDEELVDLTPSTESDQEDTWADLDSGTYLYSSTSFITEGLIGWRGFDLGTGADSELESLIDGSPTPLFAVGFTGWHEDTGDDCNFEISTSSTKPRLTVYYTVPGSSDTLTWPQCNPADPCCDSNGYFRSNGYVCKSAHNSSCTTVNSTTCGGQAYEDRCTGTSSTCPDNNYAISYPAACDGSVCTAQSCSNATLQPQRTCSAGVCQRNDPYYCPNNLVCTNSTFCKASPSSSADCRATFQYDGTQAVCYATTGIDVIGNLTYNSNGNLISGQGYNYSYNDLNQLVGIALNGQTIANFSYDDAGKRVKKITYFNNTNTTTYYLDKFVQVVNASGTYNETYYYYYNYLFAKKDNVGNITYYRFDLLGNPTLVTFPNDTNKDIPMFEPFGDPVNVGERYAFTGYEADIEADLLYAKARYYDPTKGQFIQPDQIIPDVYNPQDLNKYSYVRNNPYSYTDPSGNNPVYIIGAIAFAVAVDYGIDVLFGEGRLPQSFSEFHQSFTTSAGQSVGQIVQNPGEFGLALGAGIILGKALSGGNRLIGSGRAFSVSDESAAAFRTIFGSDTANSFTYSQRTLQHEFKHAADFGVSGNYNLQNANLFKESLNNHVNAGETITIKGTFRGTIQGTHYYNTRTDQWAFFDNVGEYRASWKLDPRQVSSLKGSGNVQ